MQVKGKEILWKTDLSKAGCQQLFGSFWV